ncbi:MAG: hypothetical protein IPL39_17850 [Opitutaceae bacterium]|nr:hypothetical protein [Opitutaceae bacterium]
MTDLFGGGVALLLHRVEVAAQFVGTFEVWAKRAVAAASFSVSAAWSALALAWSAWRVSISA